jgi:hypothetical protein
MKKIITFFVSLFFSVVCFDQVDIGAILPAPSAILELQAPNKSLILTRVVNTTAILTAVNGMLIYDISSNCLKKL